MKKLFLILLLLTTNTFAQRLTVVVPWQAGTTLDLQCRHIMETYDSMYNSTSVILNMPGADQALGYKHYTTMNEQGFFCSGNGVMGVVQKLNPNLNISPDLVKPVAMLSTFSYFIYSTKGNTLDEVMKESKRSGKKVLVGAISNHAAKMVTVVLDDNKVSYDVIAFRKPSDSLPSLKDKQLDLYVDGGTMKQTLDSMPEVKEIAYVSTKNISTTENLYRRSDNIKYLVAHTIIFVNSNVSDSEVTELNRRFNDIMKRQDTVDFMKSRFPYHTINPYSVKEIELYTNKLKHYMTHVYN